MLGATLPVFAKSRSIPLDALYATAYALVQAQRFADAACVFRAMLKAAPTDERAWVGLGECHERVGQPHLALEIFGAGSLAARPSVRCTLARARVLRALGQSATLEETLEEARTLAALIESDELRRLVEQAAEAWS